MVSAISFFLPPLIGLSNSIILFFTISFYIYGHPYIRKSNYLKYFADLTDSYILFCENKIGYKSKTGIMVVSCLLCIILNSILFYFFLTKKQFEFNLNYFYLFLIKTENAPRLFEFPLRFPFGYFKACQLALISFLSFLFHIYILSFFLLSRSSVKFSNELYSSLILLTEPVKNKIQRFRFFNIFREENLNSILFLSLLFICAALIISFQFNFHNFANILLTVIYNYIEILFFTAFLIFLNAVFILSKTEKFIIFRRICNDFTEPFLKTVSSIFLIKFGNYDFLPLLTAIFIYLVYSFFSLIIIQIFMSYNIAF